MSRAHPDPFAPRWLRCASCLVAMIPFGAVIVIQLVLGSVDVFRLVALPFTAMLFYKGLYALIHGRCPPSSWQVVLEVCGAVPKLRE